MAITEYARTSMSKAANRVINLSIEEIAISDIDSIPVINQTIIDQIEDCISTIAISGETGPSKIVTYNYLAGKLQEQSDRFIQEASRLSKKFNNEENSPINVCDFFDNNDREEINTDINDDISNEQEKTIIIKRKIGEYLRAIAQSLACLTGQKDGYKYEPRALKPRVQI
jgi:hypothetical protein